MINAPNFAGYITFLEINGEVVDTILTKKISEKILLIIDKHNYARLNNEAKNSLKHKMVFNGYGFVSKKLSASELGMSAGNVRIFSKPLFFRDSYRR